uniref:Truncated vpr protein n=1 Tax=Human immunodeficiency virus type 1 TaxID=11676 RepID=Q8ADI7_HV1|nr:truncated vpr protein [Human immunodeficiency virus 1]
MEQAPEDQGPRGSRTMNGH